MSSLADRLAPWRPLLISLLLAAYCLWPARQNGLLPGLPFTAIGLAAAIAIVLTMVLRPTRAAAWMLWTILALLIVRIAAAPYVLPAGWAARYYANETFDGQFELSPQFKDPRWTRIEPKLRFKADTFPLHFFNQLRYNFHRSRGSEPFSAHYTGYLTIDQPRTLRALAGFTNSVEVLVDNTAILTPPARDAAAPSGPGAQSSYTQRTETVALQAGTHRVDVRYAAPGATPRALAVTLRLTAPEQSGAGQESPLVRPFATDAGQETRSRWLQRLLILTDVAVLGLIAFALMQACRSWWSRLGSEAAARLPDVRTAATLAGLAVFSLWLFVSWSRIPPTYMTIPSGYDAVGYEEHTRYLLLGDWLLNTPGTIMHDRPILYTLGYVLTMTGVHVLFGESIWHVYFVQDWMLYVAAVLFAAIARRLGGWPAAIVAFLIGLYLKQYFFFHVHYLLRETLVVFTNTLLVFMFTAKDPPSVRRSIVIGALAGYNYITDPPNLATLPLMIFLLYRLAAPALRRRCLLAFGAAWLAFFLIIPVRNAIVIGRPTPVPTEGAITVWLGNKPPKGVYQEPPPHGEETAAVRTYMQQEPRHFTTNLLAKICYALGLYSPIMWRLPNIYVQHSMVVLLSWICAGVAVAAAIRRNRGVLLIALMALIRAGYVIVFVPDQRFLHPGSMTLVPLTALGLVMMWQFRPLIAIVAVLIVGAEHYILARPALGGVVAWPTGRLLGPASYRLERQHLSEGLPATTRLRWTFPEHLSLWSARDGLALIDDGTSTFQSLKVDAEPALASPTVDVPAPLVNAIEVEAGFTGWPPYARLVWYFKGGGSATGFFPVDHTGVVRTTRIPVWQSRDWAGTIERIEIRYAGDAIEPKRIEFVTYPDVPPRAPDAP